MLIHVGRKDLLQEKLLTEDAVVVKQYNAEYAEGYPSFSPSIVRHLSGRFIGK